MSLPRNAPHFHKDYSSRIDLYITVLMFGSSVLSPLHYSTCDSTAMSSRLLYLHYSTCVRAVVGSWVLRYSICFLTAVSSQSPHTSTWTTGSSWSLRYSICFSCRRNSELSVLSLQYLLFASSELSVSSYRHFDNSELSVAFFTVSAFHPDVTVSSRSLRYSICFLSSVSSQSLHTSTSTTVSSRSVCYSNRTLTAVISQSFHDNSELSIGCYSNYFFTTVSSQSLIAASAFRQSRALFVALSLSLCYNAW